MISVPVRLEVGEVLRVAQAGERDIPALALALRGLWGATLGLEQAFF
jgi:hypothetical protein